MKWSPRAKVHPDKANLCYWRYSVFKAEGQSDIQPVDSKRQHGALAKTPYLSVGNGSAVLIIHFDSTGPTKRPGVML
jgi:hypothetical protein